MGDELHALQLEAAVPIRRSSMTDAKERIDTRW